jgi:hypothetical protein
VPADGPWPVLLGPRRTSWTWSLSFFCLWGPGGRVSRNPQWRRWLRAGEETWDLARVSVWISPPLAGASEHKPWPRQPLSMDLVRHLVGSGFWSLEACTEPGTLVLEVVLEG